MAAAGTLYSSKKAYVLDLSLFSKPKRRFLRGETMGIIYLTPSFDLKAHSITEDRSDLAVKRVVMVVM